MRRALASWAAALALVGGALALAIGWERPVLELRSRPAVLRAGELLAARPLGQRFTSPCAELSGIEVLVSVDGEARAEQVELVLARDEAGALGSELARARGSELTPEGWLVFRFEPVAVGAGAALAFALSPVAPAWRVPLCPLVRARYLLSGPGRGDARGAEPGLLRATAGELSAIAFAVSGLQAPAALPRLELGAQAGLPAIAAGFPSSPAEAAHALYRFEARADSRWRDYPVELHAQGAQLPLPRGWVALYGQPEAIAGLPGLLEGARTQPDLDLVFRARSEIPAVGLERLGARAWIGIALLFAALARGIRLAIAD